MRWIVKILGQGFMVVIPLILTFGIVLGLGMWIERMLANPLKEIFPGGDEVYRMGMGLASFLGLVFLVGLLMNFWLVRGLFAWLERRIREIPLVKTVYGAVHDVMAYIGAGKGESRGDMVVVVQQPNGWRQAGVVTRTNFEGLPPEVIGDDGVERISVYFPFSYQLGGFSYFVPKKDCTAIPGMRVEDAMRYSMMAWLGTGSPDDPADESLPPPLPPKPSQP